MTRTEAIICAVVLGLLAVLVLVLPAAQQEPPQPMPHDEQVDHCSNAKGAKAPHRCECKKEPGDDGEGCEREDVKCKVWCRPHKCFCWQPACDS